MKKLFFTLGAMLSSSLLFATLIGDGTASSPYQISTLSNLIEMRTNVNNAAGAPNSAATANYILMNNINISTSAPWTPIGNASNQFLGQFNGDGKTIEGLTIGTTTSRTTMGYSGLFGSVSGAAKISNLTVTLNGIYTTNAGEAYSGGIVGFLNGLSIIDNCHIEGGVLDITETNGNLRVGGIVGFCQNSTIVNCSSSAQVTVLGQTASKTVSAGGVVGMLYNGSYLYNSYATGAVSAKTTVLSSYITTGGLIGNSDGSTTANCYASGAVSCISTSTKNPNTGGIVGVGTGAASSLSNCIALNSTLKSVGPIPSGATNQYCFRIGAAGSFITFTNNSALESISAILGLDENNVTTTTNWQSGNLVALTNSSAGQNLGSTTALSLLTAYTASNTAPTNTTWNDWKVDQSVNNGLPIFGTIATSFNNECITKLSILAMVNGVQVNGASRGTLIHIFNAMGQQVKTVIATGGVEFIELPNGFYIVNGYKVIVR